MKDKLILNNKIEMRKSIIHGWGVFAKSNIYEGEILEEAPFLIIPIIKGEYSPLFIDHRYNFPSGNWKHQVLGMGFSSYYNHSNTPNAGWYTDEENDILVFTTNKFIAKDEEIFTYYGGENYWNDGRSSTNVI